MPEYTVCIFLIKKSWTWRCTINSVDKIENSIMKENKKINYTQAQSHWGYDIFLYEVNFLNINMHKRWFLFFFFPSCLKILSFLVHSQKYFYPEMHENHGYCSSTCLFFIFLKMNCSSRWHFHDSQALNDSLKCKLWEHFE